MSENIIQERIAFALECIAKQLDPTFIPLQQTAFNTTPIAPNENFTTHSPITLEEELIIETSKVYLDETKRKSIENLQRKSTRKISDNLLLMQLKFLSKYLLPNYTVSRGKNGSIIVSKENVPVALIRFYTDLGFHRGEHWSKDISNMISISNSLSIPTDNIFLVVLSNLNGLDNQHIASTINNSISTKDILNSTNINLLKKYCKLYIDSFNILLPNPQAQMFFLASDLHPNVIAEDIFNNPNTVIDLANYAWLSTPLNKILNFINNI